MDLKHCLSNLKRDLDNGGISDDTFATTCYVTMANKAHQVLKSDESDRLTRADASEYLSMCRQSGSDSLRYIAGE